MVEFHFRILPLCNGLAASLPQRFAQGLGPRNLKPEAFSDSRHPASHPPQTLSVRPVKNLRQTKSTGLPTVRNFLNSDFMDTKSQIDPKCRIYDAAAACFSKNVVKGFEITTKRAYLYVLI